MRAWAVVATAPGRVEFRAIEVPEPGDEDVVVRVTHSWISNGTEGSFVRGERIAGDTPRRPSDPLPFPHVPGYQKVGVVERVGAAVDDLRSGDRVFATVSAVSSGMFYDYGGHVSPAVTRRSQVYRLPDGADPAAFSGLVLTQVGYNVGTRPALPPGAASVVLGDGMVGHWSAQMLRHRGARVLLVGRHDDRLARFRPGAGDRVVNARREDPLAAAREWAASGGGDGRVHAVADTVGSVPDLEALYPLLAHGAHLVSAGFCGTEGLLDVQKLRERELTLHAPAGWKRDRMEATLTLVASGALETLPLVTHRLPASRAAEAYDMVLSRAPGVLGMILDWEAEG
jgi:2-desacetyl-2-hydroxyethyl bacteriochlorophyllide A dehydrogenase